MSRSVLAIALLAALAGCTHAPAKDSAPRVLLQGEVHDNGAGHAARAERLRERLAAGWRPAIAMEQFDSGQQAALDVAMRECADADCVVAKVVPGKSGWNWDFYKPVVALAIEYKLPLVAANLSRADASKVVKGGFAAALPAPLIARYRLDTLPAALLAAQETEVRDSHCGMLPEPMVSPMAKAQIARDVVMAQAMLDHAGRGVVLIAGNGHVRRDVAVPFWLRQQGVADAWAVGFVEGEPEAGEFDAFERIPPVKRPDPCASLR